MNKMKKAAAISILSCTLLLPSLAFADDMKPMNSGMGMTMGTGDNAEMMMKDGMAYVPLRLLAESLGYQVKWNGDDRSITLKFMGMGMSDKSDSGSMQDMYTVKVMLDSTQILVGMDNKTLAYAPAAIDGRAYVTKDFITMYLLTPFMMKPM